MKFMDHLYLLSCTFMPGILSSMLFCDTSEVISSSSGFSSVSRRYLFSTNCRILDSALSASCVVWAYTYMKTVLDRLGSEKSVLSCFISSCNSLTLSAEITEYSVNYVRYLFLLLTIMCEMFIYVIINLRPSNSLVPAPGLLLVLQLTLSGTLNMSIFYFTF